MEDIKIMRQQLITLFNNLIKEIEQADDKDIKETILLIHNLRKMLETGKLDNLNKKWSEINWRSKMEHLNQAKDMFKELGYIRIDGKQDYYYSKEWRDIIFFKKTKEIYVGTITTNELKAINKQIEELGW